MKLSKVRIRNFRSILDEEINFETQCIGLIGLNESGKSNILKALRMAGGDYTYTPKDRSKISGALPSVEFEFTVPSKKPITSLIDNFFKEKVVTANGGITVSMDGLDTVSYSIGFELVEQKVSEDSGYTYDYDIKFNKALLQRDKGVDAGNVTINVGGKEIGLASIDYIDSKLVKEDHAKFFKDLSIEEVKVLLDDQIVDYFNESFPQIIFWEYSDKFLLPSEITYEALMQGGNPSDNSAPLYNILKLKNSIGIKDDKDLAHKIGIWKTDSSERRKDGRIITEALNEYIKGIWLDYNQQLYIEFEETKITIHINDPVSNQSNFYEMEARSQGFKTFISFILTIATEADDRSIQNFLLLLDEPETHLHPSGVRYMRDELFKLGDLGNHIVYATHSIFMIDRKNLTRHLIISKSEEVTTLKRVDRNNFIQEAVIYEAMGTQLDEFSIGMKNVVFEGEIDRKLWEFYINKCLDKKSRGSASDFVLWDGGGTKNMTKFFSDKILPKDSQWHLVLDNDNAGQNLKRNLEENYKKGDIKCLCRHYSSTKDFELEDILPREVIEFAVQNAMDNLNLTVTHPFTYLNTRPIGSLVGDFKEKNSIQKEQSFQFEKVYKEAIDKNISEMLNKIEAEGKNISERFELFTSRFEKYSEFCKEFIKAFNSET